ncbi:hypothetical protein CRG98_041278 [Punica granatum]|uniref:Uncharacterized protein n=1 Tax=Punica granatum TaxID=22663 RepID=A0A2I0I3N4_PUNGR|nr:hypothetical protein CRG98_041278 [Punica granatum]
MADAAAMDKKTTTKDGDATARTSNNNGNDIKSQVKRIKKGLERTRPASIRIQPMVNVPICTPALKSSSANSSEDPLPEAIRVAASRCLMVLIQIQIPSLCCQIRSGKIGMTSYPLMDEDIKLGGRRYFEDWCGQVDRKTSGGIQFGKCLRSWNLQFIFGCWTTSKV